VQGHTQLMHRRLACSIFHPAKFEKMIIHQHVLIQQESLVDGTVITIILCHYFVGK
jgi:hypothetical protein